VFHPAGPRIELGKLLLDNRTGSAPPVKDDGARRCRTLVEGEHKTRHGGTLASCGGTGKRWRKFHAKTILDLVHRETGDPGDTSLAKVPGWLSIRNERFADILPERRDALIDDLLIIKRNLLACRSRAPRQTFHHANH
jgi:hypothetical protein